MGSDPVFVLGGAQTDFARNLTREGTTLAEPCAEAAQAGMAAAGIEAAHTVATLNLGGSATTSAAFVLSAGAP